MQRYDDTVFPIIVPTLTTVAPLASGTGQIACYYYNHCHLALWLGVDCDCPRLRPSAQCHRPPYCKLRTHPLCCQDLTSSLPVSRPPLKVLSLKIPMGEAGWLFNTLQPHNDPASDIDTVVNHRHRDWNMATLTQLSSFLFTPTLTHSLFCYPGLAGLPVRVEPSLPEALFSLIVFLPSYLVLPHLSCWVLTKLLHLRTTWVYLSPP